MLAGRQELTAGAFGECLHPERRELLVGGAELGARVDAPALAAQPLAVEKLRAREVRPQPGATQPFDRLSIQRLGGTPAGQLRAAAGLDAERPVGAGGCRRPHEPLERVGRDVELTEVRGSLDQLGEHPHRGKRVARVGHDLPGRRCRVGIAGEAVVEDRGRPPRPVLLGPSPSGRRLCDRALHRLPCLRFPALQRPQPQLEGLGGLASDRRRHRVVLGEERGDVGELAAPDGRQPQRIEVVLQLVESAGVAREPDQAHRDRPISVEVPDRPTGSGGDPTQTADVVVAHRGERSCRALQCRSRGGRAFRDVQGEPIEQELRRSWSRRRGKREGRGADVREDAAARERRRAPRPQVGLARERRVEALEPSGGVQQQLGRVAAESGGEGDLTAQQRGLGLPAFVEHPGALDELQGHPERSALEARLRGGQRALGAPSRVDRELRGANEESGRGAHPSARLRPAGGAFELGGNLLVGPCGGRRQMPGAAVRVGLAIGRLRQGRMGGAALLHPRRSIDRRARTGVAEDDSLSNRQQLVAVGLDVGSRDRHPERPGRAEQQHRIADRFSGRDHQRKPRVLWEPLESPDEALFDPPCETAGVEHAEAVRQLVRAQPARKLEQGERIPAGLGDDPIADVHVELERHRHAQERASVALVQPAHLQFGKVPERLVGDANREHHADPIGLQAAGHERERRCGRLVPPTGIVDHAQQRAPGRRLRQQPEHREPDDEPVRRDAGAHPKDGLQRAALRVRQPLEPIEQRRAQLMQAGIGELHLGLHPRRPQDGHIRRHPDQVVEQRRLADPRVPPHYQRAALSPPNISDQLVQPSTLLNPPTQVHPPVRCGRTGLH